jgi:hypothetical protein
VYAPFPGPAQGQPAPPVIRPRRSGLNWIRIAIIGTVGGLLIVGGLALVGSLEKGLTAGSTFGIPPDFPIYPGAGLIGVNEHIGSSGTTVNASWDADASLDRVTAFYSAQLNQQPWAITATNPVDGTWKVRRTDSNMTGLIRLSGHGQRTRIDVLLLK